MAKIQTISVKNLKAIGEFEANFKGCTAIITAGNNRGKTTLLRSLIDRFRSVKPEIIVKENSDRGHYEMQLTTGEKLLWEFDSSGREKLTYITVENIKQSVNKEIMRRFFPPTFDIDKFLQDAPKEQAKQLQKIIGIDFTDIDRRYKIAYDDRTEKNRDAERYHAKLVNLLEVPKVDAVDLVALQQQKEKERDRLNKLYSDNQDVNRRLKSAWEQEKLEISSAVNKENEDEIERVRQQNRETLSNNDKLRADYLTICRDIDKDVASFNVQQFANQQRYDKAKEAWKALQDCGYGGEEVIHFCQELAAKIQPRKTAEYPTEPTYSPTIEPELKTATYPGEPTYIAEMPDRAALDAIDEQILKAQETNQRAAEYQNYLAYKTQVGDSQQAATDADVLVKSIEAERAEMIRSAKFPKGVSITADGITVDGFPLDRTQLSASKITITALQIASMNLGEVRTLCFDASFLDRNSLNEIEAWAEESDLQLLIERPDWDGGELRYEIIEEVAEAIAA